MFIENSKNAPVERVNLNTLHTCHQSDDILFEPLGYSLAHYWRPPYSNFKELYKMNVWIMLRHLYEKECVRNPEARLKSQIDKLLETHASPYLT